MATDAVRGQLLSSTAVREVDLYGAAKRPMGVELALLLLACLCPVLLACALAVALETGWPVLFRQERIGERGRRFTMLKFRSMKADADPAIHRAYITGYIAGKPAAPVAGEGVYKLTNDPRITRVGAWLRRTSLDELPQLWNVLRGEMSLVGPRPPLPDEVSRYDIWHRRRLSMKPGITGLWQVRGRLDPNFDHWVSADLEYIDRWSLWLDLRILARTIPAALQGR